MGVVYLGRDPVIGRLVALKTIRLVTEDDVEQREFQERFLREAQAAGILSHPNIVTVHDVGEDAETGTSFIAMEFVEGRNLKQLIADRTTFAYERIAEIIGQVAEALDYAHRRGIVHRDVKPANIIITPEGQVKITDFGIAKIEKSNLTSTGQFLGTPNYMSPEQVTGDAVDGRSDLFSLGVVLYELLTRKKPFTADNLTSISYKIVHEVFTPPETYDASIPAEFTAVLQKALAKDPGSRYQRGNDFALALYEFKAREEERQMLRDLGQMVAEAEKLGPVAAVTAPIPSLPRPEPTPAPGPASSEAAPPPPAATPPPQPPVAMSPFDILRSLPETSPAEGRTELLPAMVIPPVDGDAGSRGPERFASDDWVLDEPLPPARAGAAPPVFPEQHPSPQGSEVDYSVPGAEVPALDEETPRGGIDRPTEILIVPAPVARNAAEMAAGTPPPAPPPSAPPPAPVAPPPSPAAEKMTEILMAPPELLARAAGLASAPPASAAAGDEEEDGKPEGATERIDVRETFRGAPAAAPAPPARPLPPPSPPGPAAPAVGGHDDDVGRPTEIIKDALKLVQAGPPPRPSSPAAPPAGRPAPPPPVAGPARPASGGTSKTPPPPASRGPAPVRPAPVVAPPPVDLPEPVLEPEVARPAAAPAPPQGPQPPLMKRQINLKFVVLILALILVGGGVVVGLLLSKKAAIEPTAPVDAAHEAEVKARKELMDSGNQLAAQGRYEEALAKYRELVRRAPDSSAARDAIVRVEGQLRTQQENEALGRERETRIAAAREALAAGDARKALDEVDAILLVSPTDADALQLKQDAQAKMSSDALEARKKEQAEAARRRRPTPAPTPIRIVVPVKTPEPVHQPTPTPSSARLRITFQCPFREGYVMVRLNDREIFRRNVDFGKKSAGGFVEGTVDVPAGPGEFKVWAIAADRSVNGYQVYKTLVPGGETRNLALDLEGGRTLSVTLR